MMTGATSSTSETRPEDQESFGGFQDRYVTKTAFSLTLYAVLFFIVALVTPYVAPMVTLLAEATLEERQAAASQLLLLNDTVWTTIPVVFFGALLFGLLLTKRVAGPLAHLERCACEWSKGYVAHRVSFLPVDRLDGLAERTNAAWSQVEQALTTIQQHNHELRRVADSLTVTLREQIQDTPEVAERFRQLSEASGAIKATLQPFHLFQRN